MKKYGYRKQYSILFITELPCYFYAITKCHTKCRKQFNRQAIIDKRTQNKYNSIKIELILPPPPQVEIFLAKAWEKGLRFLCSFKSCWGVNTRHTAKSRYQNYEQYKSLKHHIYVQLEIENR